MSCVLEPFAGNGTTRADHLTAPAPALTVSMSFPRSIAFDTHGNLIVPDSNYNLYRVDPSGMAEAIAGTGIEATTAPEGVPAKGTPVGIISYVVVDRDDNIYFIDWSLARIRRIDRNGILTTYAGSGTFGFSGDGGPATSAQFNLEFVGPTVNGQNMNDLRAMTLDANDALYFAEARVIRRRDLNGTIAIIGNKSGFSEDGARYPDAANGFIRLPAEWRPSDRRERSDLLPRQRRTPEAIRGQRHPRPGVRRRQTAGIDSPSSISVDAGGAIDFTGGIVFRIDADGIVRVSAARFSSCQFSGDGGNALDAVICQAWDALRDRDGNLFIADTNNNRVRRVGRQTGIINTFAGSGPPNGLERYGFGTTRTARN